MDGFHHCEQVRERETERGGGGGCNQFKAAMAVMVWALVVAENIFCFEDFISRPCHGGKLQRRIHLLPLASMY